jgi:hypothetical protein
MRHRLLVLAAGIALFVPALAQATVVLPLDFKTLAGSAEVIAHGRVMALSPQWASDRHGIDTVVTLLVATYLKGDLGAQITFRVPGGTIGRLRSVRVGAPVFRVGEEVVVFLAPGGPAVPRIVGFNQGVFRVTRDEISGARVVTSPLLAGDVTKPTPIVRGDPSRQPVPLDQFEARVRSVLQQNRADRAGQDRRVPAKDKRLR